MFEIVCVTNRKLCREHFLLRLERIACAAPDRIILREKDLPEENYLRLAETSMKICRKHAVTLTLHGFPNAAISLGADSIHLPLPALRSLTEEQKSRFKSIGTSVHSLDEAREATLLGASYTAAGHIFATSCKDDLSPRGLGFLREVILQNRSPILAIGGVTEENIRYIAECGASGACIMSGMMTCTEPEKYLQTLRERTKHEI